MKECHKPGWEQRLTNKSVAKGWCGLSDLSSLFDCVVAYRVSQATEVHRKGGVQLERINQDCRVEKNDYPLALVRLSLLWLVLVAYHLCSISAFGVEPG
jgi:hypothetical protein